MSPDKIFISVNGELISLTALIAMDRAKVISVDASGCAGLTTLPDLPNANTVDATGCTGLTALSDLPNAEYVIASECTALTALPDLPNAKTVDASGCTGLTALSDLPNAVFVDAAECTRLTALPDLPNAVFVGAKGCIGLTALPDLPNAKTVDARGCTGLTVLPDLPNAKIITGDYIWGGVDSRGYLFEGTGVCGQWRVTVGSRDFSIVDARLHWGPGGPVDRPDCLALVEKIAAEIERRSAKGVAASMTP
jgi:hypothetical protein